MPTIHLETIIEANQRIVFDLSRSIDLQANFTNFSNERAVAGRTTGLISLNETVTWYGKHLGFWQHLTSKITDFDPPRFFVDEMQKGAFKSLRHEHHFIGVGETTLMRDIFIFESPYGFLGKLANIIFLKKYMTNFLKRRNKVIKEVAESGRWREILPQNPNLYGK